MAASRLLIVVGLLSLAGCATIVASGPDRVPVNSTPSGARVFVDNVPVGMTPTSVSIPRSGYGDIRIELDGYHPVVISRGKVFNGWVVGNIVFGGIIGLIVDAAANNVTKHPEAPVTVYLQAVDQSGNKTDSVAIEMIPNS